MTRPCRGVARALPVGFAHDHRASSRRRAAPPRPPGPAWCSASRTATAAAFPGEIRAPRRRARAGCCSPSRPPPTCTPGPATPSRSAAPACRPLTVTRRRRRRPARRPTRCSRRSARRAAPSRRRRRTTSCCCPGDRGTSVFDPLARRPPGPRAHPDPRPTLDHRLPADPAAAFADGHRRAPATSRCSSPAPALVGDNLGAALDAARAATRSTPRCCSCSSALPGAVLAGAADRVDRRRGRDRRRREQALLRTRGASARQLVRLAAGRGALVGVRRRRRSGWPRRWSSADSRSAPPGFGAHRRAAARVGGVAALAGLVIAAAVDRAARVARRAQRSTVAGGRDGRSAARRRPRWMRCGLDLVAARRLAAVVFWRRRATATSSSSPPKACRTISVSYWAFAGPALLWIGAGAARLAARRPAVLTAAGRCWPAALRPLAGGARRHGRRHACSRQRRLLARRRGAASRSTVAFAVSTAIFNATYRQQAEVDALLTNGADVTVTESPGARRSRPPESQRASAHVPGVAARRADAAPLRLRRRRPAGPLRRRPGDHRRRPRRLQDAYFQGGTARATASRPLAAQPDGVLVSAETVHDFQLRPGDLLTLRLQDGAHRSSTTTVPVPLRRRGQGVPHRAQRQLPRRQRRLRRRGRPAATRSATFLVDTGGRPAARWPTACAPARHRRARSPTSTPAAASSAPA